jgi:hypothetical protein
MTEAEKTQEKLKRSKGHENEVVEMADEGVFDSAFDDNAMSEEKDTKNINEVSTRFKLTLG